MAREDGVDDSGARVVLSEIDRNGGRSRATLRKMVDGGVELILLSRRQNDGGAELAERFGDLQAEPARAAGDERNAAREVEEPLEPTAHATPSTLS